MNLELVTGGRIIRKEQELIDTKWIEVDSENFGKFTGPIASKLPLYFTPIKTNDEPKDGGATGGW